MYSMKTSLQVVYLAINVWSVFGMQTEKPCQLKKFDAGHVCVCTDNYCDSLNVPNLSNDNEWMIVTSTESGQRFNYSLGQFNTSQQYDSEYTRNTFMEINQNISHQEIIGFGGSITGAVSFVLSHLSTNLRQCIYKSYYSDEFGMGYQLMRLPIGGCDFDIEPWTYNEYPQNDISLTNFTKLHPVDEIRSAFIKDLINVTGKSNIKIQGTAWSPPRWMKITEEWPGSSNNQLKSEHYGTWANFHLKWLDLMHSAGIEIWAISTGNEPYFAQNTPFIGLNWNASEQSTWIAEHLGPTLEKSKYAAVKIHTFEDNRDILLPWLHEMNITNTKTMDYISSIGVHGYFDKTTSPELLDVTKSQFPMHDILYTEMCFGVTGPISSNGPSMGSWQHFEDLTSMLIETLMHNVNGFIDWNIILNARGGPNYIHNVVDAFIITNENFTEIYKQPLFYAAAHFAKFILPGSKRIETIVNGENAINLSSLAFLRPDGRVAAIFYNKHQHQAISLAVIDRTKGNISIEIESKSLNSLIYMV